MIFRKRRIIKNIAYAKQPSHMYWAYVAFRVWFNKCWSVYILALSLFPIRSTELLDLGNVGLPGLGYEKAEVMLFDDFINFGLLSAKTLLNKLSMWALCLCLAQQE